MAVGPVDAVSVMALRARILAQSDAIAGLARAAPGGVAVAAAVPAAAAPAAAAPATAGAMPFGAALDTALRQVSAVQAEAGAASDAWMRGETQDLAAVMLARQKASLAFEATLQVRNKLLSAYKDVMGMPL
jgi:flagellar hook-basal body complex protein FliE